MHETPVRDLLAATQPDASNPLNLECAFGTADAGWLEQLGRAEAALRRLAPDVDGRKV